MGLNATKISVKSSELKETNKFHALSKIICPVNQFTNRCPVRRVVTVTFSPRSRASVESYVILQMKCNKDINRT